MSFLGCFIIQKYIENMKGQRTILMVASSADQVRQERKTTSKAGLFSQIKNDLFMFINKFKNQDSDYIFSSREQKNLLTKQNILNWLQQKFQFSNNDCYLFYSGEGYHNGDWKIETAQNPEGDIIQFSNIAQMWKHYGKQNLYIMLKYPSLKEMKQMIQVNSIINNNVYVLSVHSLKEHIYDNDNFGLFQYILMDQATSLQMYKQIEAKLNANQIQLILSDLSENRKLNSEEVKLLFTDISNLQLLAQKMKEANQVSKKQLTAIIDQIYEKTEKIWKFQETEENVKQLYIKHAKQIQQAAKQGNAKACFLLGRKYANGSGVDKNEIQGRNWYQKAKDQNQKHSYYGLYVIQEDDQKQNILLKEGRKLGCFRCIKKIALRYLKSTTLIQDEKQTKVLDCIQELFKLNVCDAHFLSIFLFRDKQSKLYNQEKANEHFQEYCKKANVENKQKQLFLGELLFDQSYQEDALTILIDFYEKHSMPKNETGMLQYQIADCFLQLNQISQAKKWCVKAVQKNIGQAFNELAYIYSLQDGQQHLMMQLLHKAIKLESNIQSLALSYRNLGSCYYNFNNYQMAFRYYYESAKLGDNIARKQCSNMLKEGEGVNKDTFDKTQIIKIDPSLIL